MFTNLVMQWMIVLGQVVLQNPAVDVRAGMQQAEGEEELTMSRPAVQQPQAPLERGCGAS